jgi:tight adherence protein C
MGLHLPVDAVQVAWLLSPVAACAGLLLLLWGGLRRRRQRLRSQVHLDRVLEKRRSDAEAELEEIAARPASRWVPRAVLQWLDGGLGRALVAAEDRQLLEQCGLALPRHRAAYFALRLAAPALLLLVVAGAWPEPATAGKRFALLLGAVAVGILLPKWWLQWRAAGRRAQAHEETPLLVDLLRLLQGTGMSLDQTLQVVAAHFREVLPLLGAELDAANRQFAAGRARHQTLQRLGRRYASEDLASLVALLGQIDRHGGAVQEPLQQFSQRLREKRRAGLRERVGKLNVKMTAVMVLTLLPALLIVVAGPGFLAVVRALVRM